MLFHGIFIVGFFSAGLTFNVFQMNAVRRAVGTLSRVGVEIFSAPNSTAFGKTFPSLLNRFSKRVPTDGYYGMHYKWDDSSLVDRYFLQNNK